VHRPLRVCARPIKGPLRSSSQALCPWPTRRSYIFSGLNVKSISLKILQPEHTPSLSLRTKDQATTKRILSLAEIFSCCRDKFFPSFFHSLPILVPVTRADAYKLSLFWAHVFIDGLWRLSAQHNLSSQNLNAPCPRHQRIFVGSKLMTVIHS